MIYIFEDSTTEFKKIVGGIVNSSMNMSSLAPSIEHAYINHLEQWLGDEFWEELITAVNGTPSNDQEALLLYLRKALGFLAIYEYSKVGAVQFTESSIVREESDRHKTAYKYQVNAMSTYALINGYEAIERLLIYLQANAAKFPTWENSEGYQESYALFINRVRTFRRFYNAQMSRYTFDYLRGLMKDLDIFVAEACLGTDFVEELKTKMKAGALSAEELQLVTYIQRAIAQFAVQEGMKRGLVKLDGNQVLVNETLEPQGYQKEGLPNAGQFSISIQHHKEWGNRLWNYARDYLQKNIGSFPTYQSYLETLEEVECADREDTSSATKKFDYGFSDGSYKIVRL